LFFININNVYTVKDINYYLKILSVDSSIVRKLRIMNTRSIKHYLQYYMNHDLNIVDLYKDIFYLCVKNF